MPAAREDAPDSERVHEISLAHVAPVDDAPSPISGEMPAPPPKLGASLFEASRLDDPPTQSGLDEAPEEERSYATPRARMHARQLTHAMTVENVELDTWIRRNVGAQSLLARADVVRIRDILIFLSEALQSGDEEARLRILDMWDAARRPASAWMRSTDETKP